MASNQETGGYSVSQLISTPRKEMDQIFLDAATPTMTEMLGVVDGSVGPVFLLPDSAGLKKFVNSGWVPWLGKIFEEVSPTESKGINRFRMGPFKFLRYRCETSIEHPLLGPNDVYCLNYDLPGNPWFIRRIRDDIKKVNDGLFLGTANFRRGSGYSFVAYFILRSTGQRA